MNCKIMGRMPVPLIAESAARAGFAVRAQAAPDLAALAMVATGLAAGVFGSLQPFAVTLVNAERSANKIDIFLISECALACRPG